MILEESRVGLGSHYDHIEHTVTRREFHDRSEIPTEKLFTRNSESPVILAAVAASGRQVEKLSVLQIFINY